MKLLAMLKNLLVLGWLAGSVLERHAHWNITFRFRAYKKLEWIHLFVLFCSISGVIEIIMAFLRREKVAKLAQLVPKIGDTS